MPGVELAERTATEPAVGRFDVGDGTTGLLVSVEAKGAAKSTVVVEHLKLADTDEREARGGVLARRTGDAQGGDRARGLRRDRWVGDAPRT